MKQVILSERKTKSQAALSGKTLQQINNKANFGPNFIYRLWGRDNIELATINRIAHAIGCSAFDLMEEIDQQPATPPTPATAPARERQRAALAPAAELSPAEAERRAALLAQAAGKVTP